MKRIIIAFVLLSLAVPLLAPFLKSGYFTTHDGEWAIIRLTEMHREIKDLQIPPRWSGFLNHGFGYPLFLFTYPFPYYVGDLLHIFGLSFVNAIKAVFLISIVGSAFFMFQLGRKLWGTWSGVIAAAFYLYAPFRLIDLFIRGSVGESLALMFFPLLFLLGLNLIHKPTKKTLVYFSLSFSALLLTHNVFGLLFTPIIGIFLLALIFREKNKKIRLRFVIGSFALGIGLAAYFWLPALAEQQYTVLSSGVLNRPEKFLPLSQLFAPLPPDISLPVHIGLVHIVGFILGVSALLYKKGKDRYIAALMIAFSIGIIILITPLASLFWELVPLFSSVDFSWRYLGPLIFILSLGAGAIGTMRLRFLFIPVFLILLFSTNQSLLEPTNFFNKSDQYYETNDGTTTAFDELMPIWVHDPPGEATQLIAQNQAIQSANILTDTSHKTEVTLDVVEETLVEFNKLYFPGWTGSVDNQTIDVEIQDIRGTIVLPVSKGVHTISLQLTNTLVRNIANAISIISIGIAGMWLLKRKI